MDLVVQVDERGGWAVVHVSGDLDLTTAPGLRERVVQVISRGQPRVILDLQEVDFVDSTGLGVLVALLKRSRSLGGDLRLVSTRTGLQKIVDLTDLDRALPLARTVDEAISGSAG